MADKNSRVEEIRKAIGIKLNNISLENSALRPAVYFGNVPQNFKTPSFLITVVEQSFSKRLSDRYQRRFNSRITFDVAYFSSEKTSGIQNDCFVMQEQLFRELDFAGTYRVLDKQATITDDVLHFTFDIVYSEMNETDSTAMQKQETNPNIKE